MYKPAVNIGHMSPKEIKRLTPGQWVYTDTNDRESRGRFWGVKPSGPVMVAWNGNAKQQNSYWEYQNALRHYANTY